MPEWTPDIIKQMPEIDIEASPTERGAFGYFSPKAILRRGLYPALEPEKPIPEGAALSRRELAQRMRMGGPDITEMPSAEAMTPPVFMKELGRITREIAKAKGMEGAAAANLWDVMKARLGKLHPSTYEKIERMATHGPEETTATGLHYTGRGAAPRGISLGTHGKEPWATGEHELAGHEMWQRIGEWLEKNRPRGAGRRAWFQLESQKSAANKLSGKFDRLVGVFYSHGDVPMALAAKRAGYLAYRNPVEEYISFAIPDMLKRGLSQEEASRFLFKNVKELSAKQTTLMRDLTKRYKAFMGEAGKLIERKLSGG